MTVQSTSTPSADLITPLSIIDEALPATAVGQQVICDLTAILHAISKVADAEIGRLAAIGIRIIGSDQMEEFNVGHDNLRLRLLALHGGDEEG